MDGTLVAETVSLLMKAAHALKHIPCPETHRNFL